MENAFSEAPLALALLQLAVIVVSAQICGLIAQRLGQTRVIGEILAGIALGPSVLGMVSPEAYTAFQSGSSQGLYLFGQVGLVLLMFHIGLEFDLGGTQSRVNQIASVAVAVSGIVIPFLIGVIVAAWSHRHLAPSVPLLDYSLFCGVAMSITAIPVLGRIMIDLGIARSAIGGLAMKAAAITDVLGWLMLAVVMEIVSARVDTIAVLEQVGMIVLYVLVCWFVVRPMLDKLLMFLDDDTKDIGVPVVAALLITVLLSGYATVKLGLHGAFGGLVIGILVRKRRQLADHWQRSSGVTINALLVPLFFYYAGSHADFGKIVSWDLVPWCIVFFLAAILGKFGGCYVASRIVGLVPTQARVIAALMNTRGLMELLVLTIGLDLGVIPMDVYSLLVVMAIGTTLMTAPLVRRWMPAVNVDAARELEDSINLNDSKVARRIVQ